MFALLILSAGFFIYYFICGMTYSEGTRSGILTKVSKKGFLFKTYEGEIIIGGLNQGDGAILPARVFNFSVREKGVYDQLEKDQGKKVVLHYREVIKSFFWQGETNYFVDSVTYSN
ncbi:MAG: 6-phosphogluconate dehydrogenase [Bacteroidia bacterium]|nr:6-phosphogluconate dehydrogenase [Bacteroidia bacterium]